MGRRKHPNEAEIKQQIAQRISEGQTLRAICREAGMPAFRTVYLWMAQDADFAKAMQAARETGFEAIAEDCLSIADEAVESSEDVQRNKLRVHTRLQLLAKWSNRYSDRSHVTVGADDSVAQMILAARSRLNG